MLKRRDDDEEEKKDGPIQDKTEGTKFAAFA